MELASCARRLGHLGLDHDHAQVGRHLMADLDAYPGFGQLLGSTVEWADDMTLDTSVSGIAHGRAFFTRRKGRFTLLHRLTSTQYATLLALYDANRLLRVTLTWSDDQAQYVCYFDGAPSRPEFVTPTLTRVTVKLAEQ
jgi:hypothetical protein